MTYFLCNDKQATDILLLNKVHKKNKLQIIHIKYKMMHKILLQTNKNYELKGKLNLFFL